MKLRDFFVPKYVHSDPEVRINFINKTTDKLLLESIMEKDKDSTVVQAARDRLDAVTARVKDTT